MDIKSKTIDLTELPPDSVVNFVGVVRAQVPLSIDVVSFWNVTENALTIRLIKDDQSRDLCVCMKPDDFKNATGFSRETIARVVESFNDKYTRTNFI